VQANTLQPQSYRFRGRAVCVEDGEARARLTQPGGNAFADSLATAGYHCNLSLQGEESFICHR
jgi:hypothetical protein